MKADAFAKVALSDIAYSIDKAYDYKIPKTLSERALPGVRVVVPFGKGNHRREGFIIALSDNCTYPTPKILAAVLDDAPVLDKESIKLALWMCERYYCTFFDAFRAMVPAGMLYSLSGRLLLTPDMNRETAYSLVEGQEAPLALLSLLFDYKGDLPAEIAENMLGKKYAAAQRTLLNKGIILTEARARRRVGDKIEVVVTLEISAEEARDIAETKGRGAAMQKAVLGLLAGMGSAHARDICYFTGCSMNTLKALLRDEVVSFSEVQCMRTPGGTRNALGIESAGDIKLNEEQQAAFDGLKELMDSREASCALLHGITGSGKTSVYEKLIDHALQSGGQALVLVPEIALTPQLMERFTALFGEQVALLHSGLSAGERLDEWKRIKQGIARVAVGARSAVFAPFDKLMLVILDEEHEQTYKSENTPRYHARDIAKYRSFRHNALLILGSATPDIESAYSAKMGTYKHFSLKTRYNDKELPEVLLADMREELRRGFDGTVGEVLRREIERNLTREEQTILFLNRRGYNRCLVCIDCGNAPMCPRCSVSLTYHAANNRLMCHFCGHSEPNSTECPSCGGKLRPVGAGTQKVTEELAELFPHVKVLRMDADTTTGRDGHQRILQSFRNDNAPILVGTQMVAKGLNFPNVTLVGVINADSALYLDDYRANERSFALLTQVAGRAGRAEKLGRAVIQTVSPNHPVLGFAAEQDYEAFYENEIDLRRAQSTPPFSELTKISVFGIYSDSVRSACLRLRGSLDAELKRHKLDARVFGPAPAAVSRVNNLYRFQLIVSCKNGAALRHIISGLLRAFPQDKRNKSVHISADSKPSSF